ncbi:hypothetical protein [Lysobacter gummosus]
MPLGRSGAMAGALRTSARGSGFVRAAHRGDPALPQAAYPAVSGSP